MRPRRRLVQEDRTHEVGRHVFGTDYAGKEKEEADGQPEKACGERVTTSGE